MRAEQADRLHALVRDAKRHFPASRALRIAWVRARLRLGDAKPKVHIGAGGPARFARTLREAAFL
jgi:hypothetical protein